VAGRQVCVCVCVCVFLFFVVDKQTFCVCVVSARTSLRTKKSCKLVKKLPRILSPNSLVGTPEDPWTSVVRFTFALKSPDATLGLEQPYTHVKVISFVYVWFL